MLLAKLEKFPPFLCRLLARTKHGYRGLSHEDIARMAGLPKSTVADLSFKTTWVGIPVDVADKFAGACNVDFFKAKHQVEALWHRQKVYIYRAPYSQRAMYGKLFELLKERAISARK